uniref:Putative ionotropic receptor ligand binding domain-containing protein n=1 Tax=Anopheles atroparvus TaxID=41427 RepID=A0A182JA16_ANOAO
MFVKVGIQNGNSSKASILQDDIITALVRPNESWISVAYTDFPKWEERPAYYNVVLVRDHESLGKYVATMNHEVHHFHGLYTIVLEHCTDADLEVVMEMLWRVMILNVVVISETRGGVYVAHSYHPYTAGSCGEATPMEIGRFVGRTWTGLDNWFPQKTIQFNGCTLVAGVIDIKPFSMHRLEGNITVHKGIEVTLANYMAHKMNFTIAYRQPVGTVKWGIVLPYSANSTGLVGLIQRCEVDFGFSCIGISASRYQHLRLGTASRYGQLLMAIPPKRPYTSFEKLFQPFSLASWLCIVVCYAIFFLIAQAIFNVRQGPAVERLPNSFYTLWVLLMGGSCNLLRLDSSRLFIIGFVLNTLVIRTLYHAGMFERLQASDSQASDLNTFSEINKAGMTYYMHKTISLYFKDNPQIDPSKIRFILDRETDWEQLLYDLSQHKLDGVVTMPLDCIKYYIKQNGQRGVVYVAKSTGINYNVAFFFPKTSPLWESFSSMILRLHSAGLPNYWSREFEDNRYWSNAKTDPEPSSLQWSHISGGFYLCGILHLVAFVVFFVEIGWFRFGAELLQCFGKKKQQLL